MIGMYSTEHQDEWFNPETRKWCPISPEARVRAEELFRQGYASISSKYRLVAKEGPPPHPYGRDYARRVHPEDEIELTIEEYRAFKLHERQYILKSRPCSSQSPSCAILPGLGAHCR